MKTSLGRVVLWAFLAATIGSEAAAAANPAARTPLALDRLIGTWRGRSETFASPLTRPGRSTAVNVCQWSPSHRFVTCDQTIEPGGRHDLAVYGLGAKSGTYFYCEVDATAQACCVDRLVIKGSTWFYRSTFEYKGQPLTLRTWNRFSSADHYMFAAEISRDHGRHWQMMSRGAATRVHG